MLSTKSYVILQKKSEKIDKQNHHLAFSWMEDSFGKEFLG